MSNLFIVRANDTEFDEVLEYEVNTLEEAKEILNKLKLEGTIHEYVFNAEGLGKGKEVLVLDTVSTEEVTEVEQDNQIEEVKTQTTYTELIKQIAEVEGFDPIYTINNLTVEECFPNSNGNNWNDIADTESLKELEV